MFKDPSAETKYVTEENLVAEPLDWGRLRGVNWFPVRLTQRLIGGSEGEKKDPFGQATAAALMQDSSQTVCLAAVLVVPHSNQTLGQMRRRRRKEEKEEEPAGKLRKQTDKQTRMSSRFVGGS